jgi:hypothetical protein
VEVKGMKDGIWEDGRYDRKDGMIDNIWEG